MIDWPNAIVGFLLGILATIPFWVLDRRRAKLERTRDTWDLWISAAKEIELLTYQAATTSLEIYLARVKFPIDSWRKTIGSEPFRLLEELENGYQRCEHIDGLIATEGVSPRLAEELNRSWESKRAALMAFANHSRRMQSEAYSSVIRVEQRQQLRRDFIRHPARTWLRERHNRKVRIASLRRDQL